MVYHLMVLTCLLCAPGCQTKPSPGPGALSDPSPEALPDPSPEPLPGPNPFPDPRPLPSPNALAIPGKPKAVTFIVKEYQLLLVHLDYVQSVYKILVSFQIIMLYLATLTRKSSKKKKRA